MAASSRRVRGGLRILPTSGGGMAAAILLAASIALLLGRLILTPLLGLPLNFLVVCVVAGAAGAAGLLAIALQRDRSVGVMVTAVVGLLAGVWLLAEAAGDGGNPPQMKLGDRDNGSTVTVAQGTVFTVLLDGSPTTGYSWEASLSRPGVLVQTNAAEFTPSSSALGAGGTYAYQYRAIATGTTDLTLLYRRPWEIGVAPLKTYRVTIVVQ